MSEMNLNHAPIQTHRKSTKTPSGGFAKLTLILLVRGLIGFFTITSVWLKAAPEMRTPVELKAMSLDELLDTKVIAVSRTLEVWKVAPSAIAVLTQAEIHRSGATRLAEALRLAPGLNVQRYVGSSYGISARGFSASSVNKMQVMMDGRSLFTPLFSGVFWEVQDTLLENIDRIEIIRGPGAALWGANAMNGVINIVSKNAKETQGGLITGGGGTEEKSLAGLRYGSKIGEATYYRAYFKYQKRDTQRLATGSSNNDGMEQSQGGFRLDSNVGNGNQVTVQGDLYVNRFGIAGRPDAESSGENLIARWTHEFSTRGTLQVQAYYDHAMRDVPLQFREDRSTFDFDVQHHFKANKLHDIVVGAGFRTSSDKTGQQGRTFVFSPANKTLSIGNAFVQDQITLSPERLTLTLGSKFEHNTYTRWEVQPSLRLAFTPDSRQTVWAGISRAVRSPTRSDTESRFLPIPANGFVLIKGSPDFESEDLLAYELGYRVQPHERVFIDVAAFHNSYSHLRTLEPSPPSGFPLLVKNEREGHTYGADVSVTFQVSAAWQLHGSYSYLHENLRFRPNSRDSTGGSLEGNDPPHLAKLRSSMTLAKNFDLDWTLRYTAELPNPKLPSYTELDVRFAWRPMENWELTVVGQNLLDHSHPEFAAGGSQPEVKRGVYGQFAWRF